MAEQSSSDVPVLERRQEIFRLLVVAQDHGMDVGDSYRMICTRFGLSTGQLRLVEREGLDANWPPL
jgi:hypothetical protein